VTKNRSSAALYVTYRAVEPLKRPLPPQHI